MADARAAVIAVFPISVSVAVTKYDFNGEDLPCRLINLTAGLLK
jgi:ABC-type sulfate transport system permease subunit